MNSIKYYDSNNNIIDINVVGFFYVDVLNKKFVIYSVCDDNIDNDECYILIGEVVKFIDGIKIIGVLEEDFDIVMNTFYELRK